MLRKIAIVDVYVLDCLSKPERTYQSLTPQLDTVIIKVSSAIALSLRGNPQRLHAYRAKHLQSRNRKYGDITVPKLSSSTKN